MALPSSGSISLGQVNTELAVADTATRSLDDSTTRALFGVSSGSISLSQGYGKSSEFAFAIASNQTNANLATLATNAGWNGSSKLVATINSGIYLSSSATNTAALTVNGAFPGGVSLTNNGFIVGRGGNGGAGRSITFPFYGSITGSGGGAGAAGGLALSVSSAISITNNGTVAGGGGGGGGGRAGSDTGDGWSVLLGSGGGGGGRSSNAGNSSGGGGGSASSGYGTARPGPGGAGGAGTVSSQGGGGGGGARTGGNGYPYSAGGGGAGGGWGAAGGGGGSGGPLSGKGGPFGGGGGGAATSGGANITWVATGTRLGSLG